MLAEGTFAAQAVTPEYHCNSMIYMLRLHMH